VAHLVCNFADGVDGKPPLLTHDDVTTLFHEFGHGLHHMLTQVNERDVAGISGVEWDAVELPSQFMENFCWEWDVLRHMTAHVDTGEPLPRALFDKMIAAKNFQSGMQTLRQIEFALFDMLLHTEHDPAQDFMPLLDLVRAEVAVLQPPAFSRTAHTFSHIFAGGYAAGYYSYKWAEVLSADAYAAFEETAGNDGTCPAPKPAENTARPSWRPAAAGRPWNRSRPSAAASPATGRPAAPPGHGAPRPLRPLWPFSGPYRQPPAQRRQQPVAHRVNPLARPSTPVHVPPPHPHRCQIPTRPTSASERTATAGQVGSLE
jgi:hypothetical protein